MDASIRACHESDSKRYKIIHAVYCAGNEISFSVPVSYCC